MSPLRAHSRSWAASAVALTALVLGVAPARAVVVGPVRPGNLYDGVAWANYYRAFGESLPAVVDGGSQGPQNVANWLAGYHVTGDRYCSHYPDAAHPWPGGDADHSVLFCGPPTLAQAIEGWVGTPYHGAGFVDPAVTAISFGFNYDTSAALFHYGGAGAVSRWPRPDGVLPSPSFTSGESPDPRAACAYPPAPTPLGRPIFLTLAAQAAFGGAAVSGPAGPMLMCALHANPFEGGQLGPGQSTRQVAILTREPYERGQTYTATVVMDGVPYTWSFLVANVPGAPGVAAAPSGPGRITVSWAPADPHGLPVTAYVVHNATTGVSMPVAGTATSASFDGLVPGATYDFRVTAINDVGAGPVAGASTVALALPAAPVITAAVAGDGSATVSWSGTATAEAPVWSYQLELDGALIVDAGARAAYQLSGLGNGHTYTVRVRAVNGAGPSEWSAPATVTPGVPTRLFYGLAAPVRAADTRQGGGALPAGTSRAVDVVTATGASPGSVAAISMNLTATNATAPGYLTAWPCDQPQADASSVNYAGGEPGVPNHVIVPVAADGTVCVFAGVNGADVIVDVDGWFAPTAGLVPQTPYRALDTRAAGPPQTDVAVAVAPPGATGAVVNVTAAGGSSAAGFVTAYACGATVPLASNLNFLAGQTVANAAVVPVADDGTICLHANTPTHLLVDVAGYITANFTPTGPSRALDTREAVGPTTGVDVVPAAPGAAGAVLNVTAAGGSVAAGYVTVHPAGEPTPGTSNLNFRAAQVVANAAVVRPDAQGAVHFEASTPVHLVVDVAGYFT